MISKIDSINLGFTAATVTALIWVFSTFATASEVDELKVSIFYGQFYDRLDDYDEAVDEGNEKLAEEYKRQMERLKAKICESDPQWERCD